MAQFYCLEAHQAPTDQPNFRYPKSIALLMLRRGQADRIGPRLIKRRAHCDYVKPPNPDTTPQAAGKLPPREVPGCFWQPPQSDTWRLEHRTVTFMVPANA